MMPLFADSAGLVPCGGPGEPNCEVCDFFVMSKGVIDFMVLEFIPPVAVLFFVVGGIVFYTSGGSQSRVEWAKKTLFSIIIGLIVVYGAWMIIDSILLMVSDSFTVQPPGFPWPWNEIQCK